jgi:two-component system, OmpR family, response regulator CssR
MQYAINLVEDEQSLNDILCAYLKREGWIVKSFINGEDVISSLNKENDQPHIWILDIMLPDIDGYQLLKEIKKQNEKIPVIFISARDAELDRVLGLEMGSEDYISKPFMPRELIIRVRNVLERIYGIVETKTLRCGKYVINETQRSVYNEGLAIDLTSKEFDLLCLFCRNTGKAYAREQILQCVWGVDYFGSDRVVDDLVRRLRKKMPNLKLESIYGYGYRLIES